MNVNLTFAAKPFSPKPKTVRTKRDLINSSQNRNSKLNMWKYISIHIYIYMPQGLRVKLENTVDAMSVCGLDLES